MLSDNCTSVVVDFIWVKWELMTDQREIDIIWLINTVFLSLFDPTSISIIYYLHVFGKSILEDPLKQKY